MKRFLILLVLSPLFSLGQMKRPTLKLTGTLNQVRPEVEWVHFSYRSNGTRVHDSAKVTNQKFSYTVLLFEPTLMTLYPGFKEDANGSAPALNFDRDYAQVFASAGKNKLTLTDSFSNVSVKGSKAHEDYVKLNAAMKSFTDRQDKLGEQWMTFNQAKNEEGKKKIEEEMEKLDAEENASRLKYFENNIESPIAIYMLKTAAGWEMKPDLIEPLYNKLSDKQKGLPSGQTLWQDIEVAKKTGIGVTAMDFTQNDPDGKPVSLSSFRGSYVLVDFWASWCGPCRVENPNVVKAYNKYKDRGFTILGVSLDREGQKDRWLKAIADDKLTWTHVSDLKFWENAVAVQYGIKAIPQNLLIDPQGKIIAKNLRGEDLDAKLAELIQAAKTF